MMREQSRDQRRLVIKTFAITDVRLANECRITDQILEFSLVGLEKMITKEKLISRLTVEIIPPGKHQRWTNSILDFIPISTKVLGVLGEGITHTLTGVYVMLTGVDERGQQLSEFGSSAGILKEKLFLNRAGTPQAEDFIISFNVVLKAGAGFQRSGPMSCHRVCDGFMQSIRDVLKKSDGRLCTEKHVFYDQIKPGKKRVAIVKQIAGQGAMHDNLLLPKEPSGVFGGRSIIDMGNVPLILTPNEYRDGALRAMT